MSKTSISFFPEDHPAAFPATNSINQQKTRPQAEHPVPVLRGEPPAATGQGTNPEKRGRETPKVTEPTESQIQGTAEVTAASWFQFVSHRLANLTQHQEINPKTPEPTQAHSPQQKN